MDGTRTGPLNADGQLETDFYYGVTSYIRVYRPLAKRVGNDKNGAQFGSRDASRELGSLPCIGDFLMRNSVGHTCAVLQGERPLFADHTLSDADAASDT